MLHPSARIHAAMAASGGHEGVLAASLCVTAACSHKCVSVSIQNSAGDTSVHHLCKYGGFHTTNMISVRFSNVSMLILAIMPLCAASAPAFLKKRQRLCCRMQICGWSHRNLPIFYQREGLQKRTYEGQDASASLACSG